MRNWERWLLPLGLLVVALCALVEDFQWLAVYAWAVLVAGIALFRRPVVPDFDRREGWALLGLVGASLAQLWWFQFSEFSLLTQFSFFALAWFAWREFTASLRWSDFWWPLFTIALGFSAWGLWPQRGEWWSPAVTEAAVLALVLLWACPRPANLAAKIASVFAGGAGLAIALSDPFLGLALLISLAVWVLCAFRRAKAPSLKMRHLWPAFATLGFALALVLLAGIKPPAPNFAEKLTIWKNTLTMVKAHPLGVGSFPFAFVPFHREFATDDKLLGSPQNEFLRFLAEGGIALFLLVVLAWVYFFVRWGKKSGADRAVILPLSAFFFVMMCCQSPWLNPFVFSVGAVGAGSMAAAVWRRRMLPAHAGTRALLAVSLLLLGFCFGKAVASRAFERSASLVPARVACRAVPTNWRACLNYARLLLANGESTEARREIDRVLEQEPHNYVAIRHLAYVAQKQGDRLEACFLTWKYDDLFHGKSQLSEQYLKNCAPKWRDYFQRKRPKKYYRR